MRLLLLISWNDLRQSFSDKTLLLLMFAAPLAIATIISVTFGSLGEESSPLEELPVAVVNADRGSPIADFGDEFVQVVESNSLFPGLRAFSAPDEETARGWLIAGRVSAIIILPDDLSRRLTGPASRGPVGVRVVTRPDREISGDIAVTLSHSILGGFAGALGLSQAAVSGVSTAESVSPQSVIARSEFAELTQSLRGPMASRIVIEQEALQSGGIGFNPLVAFGATQAIFFALFTANGNATSILEEERDGTLIRLFASPTRKAAVLAGKLVSTLVMVFVQLAMLFIAFTVIGSLVEGALVFIWGRRVGLILLVLVATAAAAAGIGGIVAAGARSPEESSVVGTTITMFMAIVGGAFGFRLGGTIRFASVVYWGSGCIRRTCRRRNIDLDERARPRSLRGRCFAHRLRAVRATVFEVAMSRIWTLARHDLRLLLVERGSFVARLLMPLAFIVVVGIANDAVQSEESSARVLELVDRDGSDLSSHYVRSVTTELRERAAGIAVCGDGGDPCDGAADYRVVVSDGFAEALDAGGEAVIRLELAFGDPQEASRLEPLLAAAATRVELALEAGDAARDLASEPYGEQAGRIAVERARELLAEERVTVDREVVALPDRHALVGFQQSVPGMGSMFVMLSVLAGASILVEERRRGTLGRTLAAPVSRLGYVIGKTTGRFIVGMLQYLVAVATGLVIGAAYGIDFGNSPLLMAAVMVSFVLAMSSVSILLATLVAREQQASGLTTLLAVTLAPLGGAWWSLDIEIVPQIMRDIAVISPFYWVMEGFRAAIHDLGFAAAALPIGVLLAIGLAASLAATLRMSRD